VPLYGKSQFVCAQTKELLSKTVVMKNELEFIKGVKLVKFIEGIEKKD